MKNNEKHLAVVLLSLFILGCSSIRARTDTPPTDWTVYPGVRKDLKEMGEMISGQREEPIWVKSLVTAILIVDLPASAVLDTLATPYDLYRLYAPEP
ncbi:MAG: YceK/YidQ family lipoprotein [Methylohalobius sp.]|nr:YceK/YidQ family lipoprotein [Methylohalobius sp.]